MSDSHSKIVSKVPEKMFFRIGEVSILAQVKPHVLRYWETEFSQISPGKSRSGQRRYSREEVITILKIRELLHVRRFSIEGARLQLKADGQKLTLRDSKNKELRDLISIPIEEFFPT